MDLVGKVLAGRYEILEEVGKGGMAYVYKAHCRMLNRYVAIKVLREDFENDKEVVRRFNIEAQAAAGLSNPHIVSVYDVGCEDGMFYIVMEYVEGRTLKQYIDEVGVIPWREAVGYAAQICDGLQEAHKNSVIHRDIKPQNIIMTKEGVLKVTDFGIARATSQTTMTMGKNTIGTVHYLSPEQARGGYTDERSDVYSLGIVLYEMLTGKLPFNDESPVTIAIKHLQEKPVPPTELNPKIPKSLEQIVLKAIEKEQAERYPSVTAMLHDLEYVLEDPDRPLAAAGGTAAETIEDGDETIKMPAIDNKAVKAYESSRKKSKKQSSQVPSDFSEDIKKAEDINAQRMKRAQKKKERRLTMLAILAAVLVIGGLSAAFMWITNGFGIFSSSEMVDIPQTVGMNINNAQEKYEGQFSIVERDRVASTKEAGTILEQDPPAGEQRRKRDDLVIYVTVSSGSTSITLQDYTGMDRRTAQEQLELAGLKVNIVEQASDSYSPGQVLNQDPKAGETVILGDLVTLYVSTDPNAAATARPNNGGTGGQSQDGTESERPAAQPTQAPSQGDEEEPSTGDSGTTTGGNETGTGSGSDSGTGNGGGTNTGSGGESTTGGSGSGGESSTGGGGESSGSESTTGGSSSGGESSTTTGGSGSGETGTGSGGNIGLED